MKNNYDVYYVKINSIISYNIIDLNNLLLGISPNPYNNNILFINRIKRNAFICCLLKSFHKFLINNINNINNTYQKILNIKSVYLYDEPSRNQTYGFYIKSDMIDPKEILEIFCYLELNNFIFRDSFNIYLDNNNLIVTFEKINKIFISKLKILLDKYEYNKYNININWLRKDYLSLIT